MTKIVIADCSKPSLVMSSEVFKDKIPGSIIYVANNGRETLELVSQYNPDLCVVDFDLPDVDGATLIVALRKIYHGPILMTAYPTEIVDTAVSDLLFHYNDASSWIRKPVRFETLAERIDNFLIFKRRIGKRFDVDVDFKIAGTASAKGKKASSISGRISNLSFGGARLKTNTPELAQKLKSVNLSIFVPTELNTVFMPRFDIKEEEEVNETKNLKTKNSKSVKGKNAKAAPKAKAKPKQTAPKIKLEEFSFKAEIAWVASDGQIGLRFAKLSTTQKNSLEKILRLAAENHRKSLLQNNIKPITGSAA